MNIFCLMRFHSWKYDNEIFNVIGIITRQFKRKEEARTRLCKVCSKKQYFTDKKWKTI